MEREYFINVTKSPYNADPTGVVDSTNAIQTAIDNTPKGTVLIPEGNYKLSSGLTISNKNSIQIKGAGAFGGTTLLYQPTSGDVITFNECQHCNISLLNIQYAGIAAGGNAITIDGDSYVIECSDLRMDYCYNGIWIKKATETRLNKVQFRYLLGDYGILFGGGGSGCYRAILEDIMANNPYPEVYPSTNAQTNGVGDWMQSTAYGAGSIVKANGNIYQCTEAGTSESSGTGPTGNGGGLRSPIAIIDGSAKWKFVSKQIIWIKQDQFGYSLVINKAALINGYIGVQMSNEASANDENWPMWIFGNDIECDHNYYANMNVTGGEGIYVEGSWFGSCLAGNAINLISDYKGQFSLINSRVSFAAQNGMNIGAAGTSDNPKDVLIQSNFIGGNGQRIPNEFNGIVAAAEGIIISNNVIGKDIANNNASQFSGVYMLAEARDFIIKNNDLRGNVTTSVEDKSNGTSKIVRDNLPISQSNPI